MAAQSYEIEFSGYWREPNKGGVPAKSGLYCVYSCVNNANEKTVTLKKLIYIGESEDAKARIANHEKLPDWKKHLKSGEELCYSFAPVSQNSRLRCEAAMINKHKPPVNTEFVSEFPYDKTTMKVGGRTSLLHTNFTVG